MPSAAIAAPTAQEIPPSALGAHWLRLGPESRRQRFNGMVTDDGIREMAATNHAEVILAIDIDGRPRATLEIFLDGGRHAEIAISVEDPYQGMGYGRRLLDEGLERAAALGVETAELYFARGNTGIIRLALGVGAEIEWQGADGMAIVRCQPEAGHDRY
jgi:ribosomal protein S18 acetylase RimI-like enzyme